MTKFDHTGTSKDVNNAPTSWIGRVVVRVFEMWHRDYELDLGDTPHDQNQISDALMAGDGKQLGEPSFSRSLHAMEVTPWEESGYADPELNEHLSQFELEEK